MPHLQVEASVAVDDDAVDAFVDRITAAYAERMDTGTGHIAVTVRDEAWVALGRAGPDEPAAVVNADIRAGRTAAKRRAFANVLVEALEELGVPPANTYVVYTEHPGEDFHLAEGPLDSWDATEDADGAL
jgi:phenylpyruvate tautomerase PptA (4-oxalocrotonate tautomerase family)